MSEGATAPTSPGLSSPERRLLRPRLPSSSLSPRDDMPTDSEIETLATATLPSRRLELRRDDDGLTISVVLTVVEVVEDPGRELAAAAVADLDASAGDELMLALWSPSAIDEALLE